MAKSETRAFIDCPASSRLGHEFVTKTRRSCRRQQQWPSRESPSEGGSIAGRKYPSHSALIEDMVERDVRQVSTFALYDRVLPPGELRRSEPQFRDSLARLLAAGGQVAMGSDHSSAGLPSGMPVAEFERMVSYGMTPLQALQAATLHSARPPASTTVSERSSRARRRMSS